MSTLALSQLPITDAFSRSLSHFVRSGSISRLNGFQTLDTRLYEGAQEVDVSDLGLTMDDLNAPLPAELLQGIATSGYESTSRIPSIQDDACMWTEEESLLKVTLAIPGLRGQPAAALAVEFATNTVSIMAFGMVVWSAILRGQVKPESCKFETSDGPDMIPVIDIQVEKADSERWGGFILQIGENSIL